MTWFVTHILDEQFQLDSSEHRHVVSFTECNIQKDYGMTPINSFLDGRIWSDWLLR